MGNKVAALLLLCLVFIAAVQLPKAHADEFAKCFNECEEECQSQGHGNTYCESKCDTDCFNKDVDPSLHMKFP